MFERFTLTARLAVENAKTEAVSLGHHQVGTEHLLLGLITTQGQSGHAFEELGVDIEDARKAAVVVAGTGEDDAQLPLTFTLQAKHALELALREALSLGNNYIGAEHLLLGVVRAHERVADKMLLEMEIDAQAVRNQVIHQLSKPENGRPSELDADDPVLLSAAERMAQLRARPKVVDALESKIRPVVEGSGDEAALKALDEVLRLARTSQGASRSF